MVMSIFNVTLMLRALARTLVCFLYYSYSEDTRAEMDGEYLFAEMGYTKKETQKL